jgi:hypothetical protein
MCGMAKAAAKKHATRPCVACGNPVEVAPTGRPRQFCSRSCSRGHAKKLSDVARDEHPADVVDLADRVSRLTNKDRALVVALLDWLEDR